MKIKTLLKAALSTTLTLSFAFAFAFSFSFLADFSLLNTASAQQSATPGTLVSPEDCPPGTTCVGNFRSVVISYINYFLSFLGLLAVVMIIYAGILMVTAAGEEEQVGKGKKIIMWSAVGIVIILLAFTIVNFVIGVQTTTG